jgi:hypothetical protein
MTIRKGFNYKPIDKSDVACQKTQMVAVYYENDTWDMCMDCGKMQSPLQLEQVV